MVRDSMGGDAGNKAESVVHQLGRFLMPRPLSQKLLYLGCSERLSTGLFLLSKRRFLERATMGTASTCGAFAHH